jgi:hypothetical protein
MKEVSAGRHIAPAIITRLPVRAAQTRLLAPQLRTLEGHIDVNGYDLVVIASHWTSHRSDDQGGKRERYGDRIYQEYRDLTAPDPRVDLLVCRGASATPATTRSSAATATTSRSRCISKCRGAKLICSASQKRTSRCCEAPRTDNPSCPVPAPSDTTISSPRSGAS